MNKTKSHHIHQSHDIGIPLSNLVYMDGLHCMRSTNVWPMIQTMKIHIVTPVHWIKY